jgi:hypothetical protein
MVALLGASLFKPKSWLEAAAPGARSSLEPAKAAAIKFSVKKSQVELLQERCHDDLHLAWSFHFRRYQGDAC